MFKKILVSLALFIGITASAVGVYDRATVTVGNTGSANWTNGFTYAALQLERVWVLSDGVATNTLTFSRITSDLTTTQAVCTVAYVGSALSTASFTAGYLRAGDILAITSGTATNASVQVEFEVQQH